MSDKLTQIKKVLGKTQELEKAGNLALAREFVDLNDKVDSVADKADKIAIEVDTKLSEISSELKKKLESELVLEIDREELKGEQGEKGEKGDIGEKGKDGKDGKNGKDGKDGIDGKNGKDGKDGVDGKDGSPDSPIQIKEKLETLKKDKRLDKSAIKGLDELVDKPHLDRAISILDQRTQFLINKQVSVDLSEYAKLAIETTQDNLYSNLIANSLLITNQWYKVTDYKTYALIPSTDPSAPVYYEGTPEIILLRATSANTLSADGYSLTHPGEKIVFKQDINPLIGTIYGEYSGGTSIGTNEITDVTQYGFTIDDDGHHFEDRYINEGYSCYIEAYDEFGGNFFEYFYGYNTLYAYLNNGGHFDGQNPIKVTGTDTFHVETRGIKISDYLDDDSFYLSISDGSNSYDFVYADLGVKFTFDDNGDFVYLDGLANPLDLTRVQLDGGWIEMGYNSSSTTITIDNTGLVTIVPQGVVYVDNWNIINYTGEYGVVSQSVAYFIGSRPFHLRKSGTLTGTFYDPVNDVTVTINDANEGVDWSWDSGTNEITILSSGSFDWNNVDFSNPSNFSIYWEFENFDLTRSGSYFYITWYYVQKVIQGMITTRENTLFNVKIPFDYYGRRVRRYRPLVSAWAGGTYNTGDIRHYNGRVYVCFQDGVIANPSDSARWSVLCDYDYKLPRKDFSIRIQTTGTTYVTGTLPYDPADYVDVEVFPTTTFDGLNSTINLEVEASVLDPDFYFPTLNSMGRSKIKLYGSGVVTIESASDSNITVSESLIKYCSFTDSNLLSQVVAWQLDSCKIAFASVCYFRYSNKSTITFASDCYFGGSMQSSTYGYAQNLTTYGSKNNNYMFATYVNSCLWKGNTSNNIIVADYSRNVAGSTFDQNIIVGSFTDCSMNSIMQQNNLVGQFSTTTFSGTFNGNTIKLMGNNNMKSMQVCNITSMSNNTCTGVDWSYMTYGTLSLNTGTGSGTVRYNKGETWQSNTFTNGISSFEIRDNQFNKFESNNIAGSSVSIARNTVYNTVNSCTFYANCQVIDNVISNKLQSCVFGTAGTTRYFQFVNANNYETCTFPYNFQYVNQIDPVSGYTQTKAIVYRAGLNSSQTFFGLGLNNVELIHSPFHLNGRFAGRYSTLSDNATLNTIYSTVANRITSNRDFTLATIFANGGAEYTIQNINTGTTTIKPQYITSTNNVTMTIASPCVVTLPTSTITNLTNYYRVKFATTGALPTGIVAGTYYWVGITNVTASNITFNLYPTLADAYAGTNKINTSGTQSGTHSLTTGDTIMGLDTYVLYGANESVYLVAPEVGSDWKFKANYIPNIYAGTSGKIGIGTSLPQELLHLTGDPTNTNQPSSITNSVNDVHTALFINGNGNAINEKYGIQFGNYSQYGFAGIYSNMVSTTGATMGDLTFDLKAGVNDATLTERMRITYDGKVGIGTTSPDDTLQVVGNVKIGEDTTNYAEFETDGTLRLYGTATVFKDELQSLIKEGLNNPSSNIVQDFAEGTLDFQDDATTSDYAIMNIQINHDWKIGSTVYPHIHWFQNQNATPNWLIQYRWQINGGTKTTAWTDYKLSTTNAFTYSSGTILQISYNGGITPPVGAGLSDILQVRLIRDTNNTSTLFAGADAYTGDAEAVNFDIHYEADSLGSDSEYTK